MSKIKDLGSPNTVGQLKEVLSNYPNATSFGFRNQPMQELVEVNSDNESFVVFQEKENKSLEIVKREHPILGVSCPICNSVFSVQALHTKFFNENDHEENARIVKELMEYSI